MSRAFSEPRLHRCVSSAARSFPFLALLSDPPLPPPRRGAYGSPTASLPHGRMALESLATLDPAIYMDNRRGRGRRMSHHAIRPYPARFATPKTIRSERTMLAAAHSGKSVFEDGLWLCFTTARAERRTVKSRAFVRIVFPIPMGELQQILRVLFTDRHRALCSYIYEVAQMAKQWFILVTIIPSIITVKENSQVNINQNRGEATKQSSNSLAYKRGVQLKHSKARCPCIRLRFFAISVVVRWLIPHGYHMLRGG